MWSKYQKSKAGEKKIVIANYNQRRATHDKYLSFLTLFEIFLFLTRSTTQIHIYLCNIDMMDHFFFNEKLCISCTWLHAFFFATPLSF